MEFYAYHGVLAHEKQIGNTFLVTVSMELDVEKAAVTDDLNDALNYKLVYDLVKEEMEIPSDLIEHVAGRIRRRLLDTFPYLEKLTVKLSKLNPPVNGKVEKVTIVLS